MSKRLLIPLLSFLALFLSSAAYSAMAQTTTSAGCGNYYQGASGAAPSGYGSSQNFFLGGQDIAVDCTAQDVNVGTGSNLEYVYKDGYIYLNNVWQKVTLSPINSPLVSGTWYNGSAKIMLPQADYSNWTFIAAYTCTYVNNSWKCGCADSACATSNWQIQAVRMPAAPSGLPTTTVTRVVTEYEVVNNATITVSVGTVLNFSQAVNTSITGSGVASISNTGILSIISQGTGSSGSQNTVRATMPGTSVVTVDMAQSSTVSPGQVQLVPHQVTVVVQ